jgi:hypothetical protein
VLIIINIDHENPFNIVDSVLDHNADRIDLFAFSIMNNHMHFIRQMSEIIRRKMCSGFSFVSSANKF